MTWGPLIALALNMDGMIRRFEDIFRLVSFGEVNFLLELRYLEGFAWRTMM